MVDISRGEAARTVLLWGILCVSPAGSLLAACADASSLCDRVEPRRKHPGMLRASEVCMRSLRPRPVSSADPHDTLRAIRDFHVTRLEWTYGLTRAFVAKVEALGCTASGACANASLAGISRSGDAWHAKYSVLDLEGRSVEAPWMRAWPGHALWHCVNNPAARAAYLAYVKHQVDQGVRDLQRDDPSMNYGATRWGGCFCPHCVRGFRGYLREHATAELLERHGIQDLEAFDYAEHLRRRGAPAGDEFARYPEDDLRRLFNEFQRESTIAFHRWWREGLNDHAGRYVPVSANNGAAHFDAVYEIFDHYIGELSYSRAQPETLHHIAQRSEELGKGQTMTMPLRRSAAETSEWVHTTRKTIATAYALGMHIEVPWDTYLPVRGAVHPPRYFGKPEQYADLFALVRAGARFLDGYETAAATGGMIDEGRWADDSRPVTVFAESPRAFAFTRALPGQPDAPIVVHLVDWSAHPRPFTVSLNPDVLFAGRPLSVSIITPKPYDRASHAAAFASGDYRPLLQESPVASGLVTTLEVGPLQPWGLLVLRPLPARPGIWPPRFVATDREGEPAVRVVSPGGDSVARVSTDGSPPGSTSPVIDSPVLAGSCREIRAVSFRDGQRSSVSVLRHLPPAGERAASLLVNGDFSDGERGWRSIVSRELSGEDALEFTVEEDPAHAGRRAARLRIRASDGVPYHLRLVQPVRVEEGARLYVTATLSADRSARVRFGIQERSAPYRVVHVGVLELDTAPRRIRWNLSNPQPDLAAQLQLDLGFCAPGTTVWLRDVAVHRLRTGD